MRSCRPAKQSMLCFALAAVEPHRCQKGVCIVAITHVACTVMYALAANWRLGRSSAVSSRGTRPALPAPRLRWSRSQSCQRRSRQKRLSRLRASLQKRWSRLQSRKQQRLSRLLQPPAAVKEDSSPDYDPMEEEPAVELTGGARGGHAHCGPLRLSRKRCRQKRRPLRLSRKRCRQKRRFRRLGRLLLQRACQWSLLQLCRRTMQLQRSSRLLLQRACQCSLLRLCRRTRQLKRSSRRILGLRPSWVKTTQTSDKPARHGKRKSARLLRRAAVEAAEFQHHGGGAADLGKHPELFRVS